VRSRVSGGYYLPLTRSLVAMVSSEAGYIFGLSDDVRVSDRFFLGGDSFRGFAPSGVGPRDKETHDALGGNILYAGTAELSFPLGFPEEFQIRGRVFSDVGTLTKIDGSTNDVEDSASLRASVGIGLTWRSPFGPIAIDLARPYLEETFDETEVFRFSFGTRF
jgi:outer membrane protein insertion porin family